MIKSFISEAARKANSATASGNDWMPEDFIVLGSGRIGSNRVRNYEDFPGERSARMARCSNNSGVSTGTTNWAQAIPTGLQVEKTTKNVLRRLGSGDIGKAGAA
jgi:hypothetical protein